MESIAQAILSLKSGPSLFDYITVVGAIIAALLTIFTIYKIFSEISYQRKQFIEAQNQKERENLTQKLNRFFGPLKELRSESKTLYDHFDISEKEQAKESEGKRFRTLRHLTQGKTFSEPDLALLGEIIKVGKKQLKLIEKEGNIITNAQLADLLGKLGAHIRCLSLAADHKLNCISERLETLVFPREVDGALETEIRVLQDRLKELKNDKPKKKSSLILNQESLSTIAYYNNNSQSYFKGNYSANH